MLAEDWTLLEGDEDPLRAERPDEASCSPLGLNVESDSVEVQTDECPWASLGQPLRDFVRADDTLELLFWHSALAAPLEVVDPEARVELHLGEHLVWELRQPIPHEATLFNLELTPGVDVAWGERAVLHVSNHGSNSYRLTHLRRQAP